MTPGDVAALLGGLVSLARELGKLFDAHEDRDGFERAAYELLVKASVPSKEELRDSLVEQAKREDWTGDLSYVF